MNNIPARLVRSRKGGQALVLAFYKLPFGLFTTMWYFNESFRFNHTFTFTTTK
jgi:hypothetical protein